MCIGIFESLKCDFNPQPNTRGIGPLVGRTSSNRRSVMHVLVEIFRITYNFSFICQYIFIWPISSGREISPLLIGWLVVLRINVDLAIFQPYLDLEAGDNQSLKIQVARPGIEPRSSCSASQELNHSATAAPSPLLKYSGKFLIFE